MSEELIVFASGFESRQSCVEDRYLATAVRYRWFNSYNVNAELPRSGTKPPIPQILLHVNLAEEDDREEYERREKWRAINADEDVTAAAAAAN